MLEGVNVALGVTGSIAAVKTVELAHELRREGATVRAVTTDSARGIIHPWALEFATERDVITEITGRVEHVELCGREGWADVLLVAPATANTVGKIASAVDDTPVTTCATTALGADVPVVVAPAMHEPMYDHPGVLDAIARLEEWGVGFVEPRLEEGKAKIATEAAIVTGVARAAAGREGPRPLEGRHVVVTAGATVEAVDPVRVLTNRASGRTGRAVARACHVLGADVTLVHGALDRTPLEDVHYAELVCVESAAEMRRAVLKAVAGGEAVGGTEDGNDGGGDGDRTEPRRAGTAPVGDEPRPGRADAVVSAAAISDYTVEAAGEKLRSGQPRTLELDPTPKLLDAVRDRYPKLPLIGFKAETSGDDEAMVAAARSILDRVGLAFVVANDASVMGGADTRALLVDRDRATEVVGSKATLGARVAEELAAVLGGGR
jgi:phosphopantothenoylcysteine decarboxylase/phosphopantothenate--cysteine ligase